MIDVSVGKHEIGDNPRIKGQDAILRPGLGSAPLEHKAAVLLNVLKGPMSLELARKADPPSRVGLKDVRDSAHGLLLPLAKVEWSRMAIHIVV